MLAAMRPILAVDLKDEVVFDKKNEEGNEELEQKEEEEIQEADIVFIINPCQLT